MQQAQSTVLSVDRFRLGRDIRSFRSRRFLTRKQAAKQMGINWQVLARIERGYTTQSAMVICVAYWADLDLRDYVDVKLL